MSADMQVQLRSRRAIRTTADSIGAAIHTPAGLSSGYSSYSGYRATRHTSEPPSDAEIERGLREKAVTDPRAAEILLRWLQRPRVEERVGGVDLDSLSERELERLYAGFAKLVSLDERVLAALVEQVLAGDGLASSS